MRGSAVNVDSIYHGDHLSKRKNEVHYNKKKRRCLICKKLLSGYTKGKYCHSHMLTGQEKEDMLEDKKAYIISKKNNKRLRDRQRKEKYGFKSSK